jgi:hypothetical protein
VFGDYADDIYVTYFVVCAVAQLSATLSMTHVGHFCCHNQNEYQLMYVWS